MNTQELLQNVKIDIAQMSCNKPFVCPYNERLLSYALGVITPVQNETPDEVFKECCYKHYVFADLETNADIKNDYSSFYHQRQLSNETVDFVLYHYEQDQEYDLNDGTYGEYYDFGSFSENEKFKGYVVKWRNVLQQIGIGSYKVIKRQTIAGVAFETESIVFTLRNFSTSVANRSVRMDIVMNGYLRKENVDFTGLEWKHSIRVKGFFGRREAQFEEDILVNRSFDRKQISMSQTNEYKFQTNLVPDCVTNEILDFFLFANDIYMNDYNLNNHSYDFQKFPVKYSGNEGTRYGSHTRKAELNLLFSDAKLNNRKNNFY